jgi:hypothetical protein
MIEAVDTAGLNHFHLDVEAAAFLQSSILHN